MSLLRFFRKDPTRDWPRGRVVPLVFDTARGELNGIPPGAPLESLRALGRPSNPHPYRNLQFGYAPLGLEFMLDASDRVQAFTCLFRPTDSVTELHRYPDFRPCELTVRLPDGTQTKLTQETTRAELEECMGPLTDEEFQGEPLASVTFGDVWLGFGFGPQDRLVLLDVEPAPTAA